MGIRLETTEQQCGICGRMLNSNISDHHLIPKEHNGRGTILIHNICHNKIHSTFTNKELLHHYHTVERLVDHPEMIKFINWIKTKPLDFYDKNDDTKHRHNKRRK